MVPLIVLVCALAMMGVELVRPGRRWPRVAGWWGRAIVLNATQAAMVFVTGWLVDDWMRAHRPWSADGLGPWLGALLGYLVITFVYYWWHRARHALPGLWRWVHQVHHSPQRLEILTSFYKHPLEMALNGVLSSAALYLVVGLGAEAALYAVLLTGLAELFYHWNVSTPRWLGYLVQRPEMHQLHHARGAHAFNYADLPLWDLLFGTFRNPTRFTGRCGFDREGALGPMLAGRVVDTPRRDR
ncbi:MAG TPA: sterol desaturase family protein [Sandaracinaceae bacterium LLY-WYZ-13_1]|nr:sterol desaturase family protein [Sandaracinaceae bacterium LLY-WYZ-13_1]